MTTTRRQWLALCGAASGSALVMSCGGGTRQLRGPAVAASSEEVRGWLAEAVAIASARWGFAEAVAMRHEHTAAAVDVEGAVSSSARHGGAVLSARSASGQRYEAATAQLDRESLLELARHLGELAEAPQLPAGAATPVAGRGAASASAAKLVSARPARAAAAPPSAAALQEEAAALAARADRHGGSRIVYRGASIDLDATTVWYAGRERALEQRILRRRAAVAVVASIGDHPLGAEASGGRGAAALVGSHGESADAALWPRLAGAGPSEQDLAAEVERVLRLTTPSAFPAGAADVVLDPSLVGGLFEAILAAAAAPEHAAAAARWRARRRPDARLAWQLVAAPSLSAYGAYLFDDTGQPAAPAPLLTDGGLGPAAQLAPRSPEEPLAGLRLRRGHLGDFAPLVPHLALVAPPQSQLAHAELLAQVKAGYALEGLALARADLAANRITLHARLARELKNGTYSGRAFADVELTAGLAELLDSIAAWSTERRAMCRRELDDGLPSFFSAELPALLGRGELRPRGLS
jgi:predicted Zn-dependent protease